MTEQKVIVKWKYRQLSPGKKHHTINGYIKYISKQVEDRREDKGTFILDDTSARIGSPAHDEKVIKEKMGDDKTFDQGKYLSYINERKGSHSLFSSDGSDIGKLVESLQKHKGYAWIPIVSMKEKDAEEYKLDTEAVWMDKAKELAEEYRKQLGISPENFRWVAAFHTKPESDQNNSADAGCMPHLHFILWEDTPCRSKPNLSKTEIDSVRAKTASVLSKDFMKLIYDERNKLRQEIVEKSKGSIENCMEQVQELLCDVRTVTEGRGKMSIGEFEKKARIYLNILEKMEQRKMLSEPEMYYVNTARIQSVADTKRVLSNYNYIIEETENVVDSILKQKEVAALVSEWFNASNTMRELQGNLGNANTAKDFQKIKRVIENGILDECKKASYDNRQVSSALRGQLIEKIEHGKFRYESDSDTVESTIKVMTTLCKSVGLSERETRQMQYELLNRSNKREYVKKMDEIIRRKYREELSYSMYVTTKEFYNALHSIQTPMQRSQIHLYSTKKNPYQMATDLVLVPPVRILSDDIKIVTAADMETAKTLADCLPNLKWLENKQVESKPDYESVYNQIIDAYSNIGQIDLRQEKENIEKGK